MVIAIEGIWKHGKIVPLEDIDVEEDTKVIINVMDKKNVKEDNKSLLKLAGAWKDFKTKDGKTLDELKKEIYNQRQDLRRREVVL